MINDYFSSLVFQKFRIFERHTDYICHVRTYDQSTKQKYIIVGVLNPDAKLDQARIKQLRWFSITTTENLDVRVPVPLYQFYKSQKDEDVSDDKILIVQDRDYEKTTYTNRMRWPIKVILLHNIKKKSIYQFPDALTFHQAVNTFNCIVKRTDF